MSVSYKYWDDCVDAEDMKALWKDPAVKEEWIDAGETMERKVHLSRDPDGQCYVTQTEMKAVAGIIVSRHFNSQLDPDMICAIADIASGRQLLAEHFEKKTKQMKIGIMQVAPETAEWLVREIGYRNYDINGDPTVLYRPFVNVYFGAAYIKWLSCYDGKSNASDSFQFYREKSEEFVIRAYQGGINKATHKSTADWFQRYVSLKQSIQLIRQQETFDDNNYKPDASSTVIQSSLRSGSGERWAYWDSRVFPEDMEELWRHPDVLKEWTKSGERRGKVRFSHDQDKRPYLSRIEVKAVAEIIVSRYFNSRRIQPATLAALAEICSMRFVYGVRAYTGLMGIDYPTAAWLYRDVSYRAYKITSVDDLYNPFVSMYFAASYLAWLSQYKGRERSHEFVVQAYLGGRPENVNIQATGPLWNTFLEALNYYEDPKKEQGGCCML